MPKSSGDSDKVMDVAKKNTPPSETSRPVILSHRKVIQDPMMKPEEEKQDDQNKQTLKSPLAATAKTLQPLGSQPDAENKPESAPEPKNDPPKEPIDDTSESNDTAGEPDEAAAEQAKEAAIVDAVANQASAKKQEDKIQTDDAKQKAIQKLIEEKTYFLPIGQITKRRQGKRALIRGLFLLIVLAGGIVVLDMELIESPVDLPFSFFN